MAKSENNHFSPIDYARTFRRLEKQFEKLTQTDKPTKRDIEATTVPAGRTLYSAIREGFLDCLSPPDWLRSETLLLGLVDGEKQPKFDKWKPDEYSLYWVFAMQWLSTANMTSVPNNTGFQWAKWKWSKEQQRAVRVVFDNEADYIKHLQACVTMYAEACATIALVLESENDGIERVQSDEIKLMEQAANELKELASVEHCPKSSAEFAQWKLKLGDIINVDSFWNVADWLRYSNPPLDDGTVWKEAEQLWVRANNITAEQADNYKPLGCVDDLKGFVSDLAGLLLRRAEIAKQRLKPKEPAEPEQEDVAQVIGNVKMTNKEKAKKLREIARNLSVWKESGPEGPEHSEKAHDSAEEAMKLLGLSADLLHYCKETYGVQYRQSESSLKSLNGILDYMRINDEAPEFITKRIGCYDYQDFAQDAFIAQLNLWADELEKDKTAAGQKDNEKVPLPIDTKGLWSSPSLDKLRKIDSNSQRDGIAGDKQALKRLQEYTKKRGPKRKDIAGTLYHEEGRIKTTMPYRSMFKQK